MVRYDRSKFDPISQTPRAARYNRRRIHYRDDSSDSSIENDRWRDNYAVSVEMFY